LKDSSREGANPQSIAKSIRQLRWHSLELPAVSEVFRMVSSLKIGGRLTRAIASFFLVATFFVAPLAQTHVWRCAGR